MSEGVPSDSRKPGDKEPVPTSPVAGVARVQRFSFRRNLLFAVTLVTLILAYLGAMPLAERLAANPLVFASFWALVFVLVAFVFGLALYDLARVRKEHGRRIRDLDKELAAVAAEARELMRQQREDEESKP